MQLYSNKSNFNLVQLTAGKTQGRATSEQCPTRGQLSYDTEQQIRNTHKCGTPRPICVCKPYTDAHQTCPDICLPSSAERKALNIVVAGSSHTTGDGVNTCIGTRSAAAPFKPHSQCLWPGSAFRRAHVSTRNCQRVAHLQRQRGNSTQTCYQQRTSAAWD